MDINKDAEKSLLKTGYTVVFQYPQSFSQLPTISFYTANEHGSVSYDNVEAFRDASVAVDIWAKTPKECGRIYEEVRSIMALDGWCENFSADVPKGEDRVYHRTMRLIKSFYTDEEE